VDERLTTISDLDPERQGETVTLAGMVNAARTINTKKGDLMAFATGGSLRLGGTGDFPAHLRRVPRPTGPGRHPEVTARWMCAMTRSISSPRPSSPTVCRPGPRRQAGRHTASHLWLDISSTTTPASHRTLDEILELLAANRGDVPLSRACATRAAGWTWTFPRCAPP
jgi:hypothetical protein